MNTAHSAFRSRLSAWLLVLAVLLAGALPAPVLAERAAQAAPTPPSGVQPRVPQQRQADRPLDSTTNILVLGADKDPDWPNWRTDVIMIVALDFENSRAGVISIPRDVYIDAIPDHNANKVNVIDYLGEKDKPDGGGPELLGSIIEEKMGIRIDHFVRFDFGSFMSVVDTLGGVEVEVDCAWSGYLRDYGGWLNLEPGVHRLDANEAFIYVRSRAVGGDLDRARRQQRFIWAVRNQMLEENLLPKLPALYSTFSKSVQTDVGLVSALRLARFALDLDRDEIHGFVLGAPLLQSGWAGGMSVFYADWEAIAEEAQTIFDRPPFIDESTPEDCPG